MDSDHRVALVIVDMLNDFVRANGSLVVPGAEGLIPNHKRLLGAARESESLVVYLTDNHLPDDPEFSKWPPHAILGTEGAQVISDLRPLTGERVIPKRRYSGFFGTDLDLTLREARVDSIILAGVLTDVCIMYTSADATARGFGVHVVSDGTLSTGKDEHEFALEHMKRVHGATVLRTDEAIDLIRQSCVCGPEEAD
jgi:nicotinamidase-related amidase